MPFVTPCGCILCVECIQKDYITQRILFTNLSESEGREPTKRTRMPLLLCCICNLLHWKTERT